MTFGRTARARREKARKVEGAVDSLRTSLDWAGLDYDQGDHRSRHVSLHDDRGLTDLSSSDLCLRYIHQDLAGLKLTPRVTSR